MKKHGIKLGLLIGALCCFSCKEKQYTVEFIYENTLSQEVKIEFFNNLNASGELLYHVQVPARQEASFVVKQYESENLFSHIYSARLTFEDSKSIIYHEVMQDSLQTNLLNVFNYTDNGNCLRMQITEKHYQEAIQNETAKPHQ